MENNSVLTKNQPTDNQNCLFTTFFNVNFQDVFLRIFFQLLLKILIFGDFCGSGEKVLGSSLGQLLD